MQIGCPGTAEVVVVYADANVNGGRTALEDSLVPEDTNPSKYVQVQDGTYMLKPGLRHDAGRMASPHGGGQPVQQYQRLADSNVSVGEIIDFGIIFNMYESCLKFTHGGATRYYGGGMPGSAYDSAQEVLKHAFVSLVWVTKLDAGWRVEEMVATQADW